MSHLHAGFRGLHLAVLVVSLGILPLRVMAATASLDAAPPASDFTPPLATSAPLAGWAAQVSAGGSHTCAVTLDGGVKCWGDNTYGQLGDGTTQGRVIPVDVVGLANGAQAIAAGANHTCALTAAGAVYCWGSNDYGQLGDGTTQGWVIPVDVVGLANDVHAIAAGANHTCALTAAGAVYCWGSNDYGQLGDGTQGVDRLTPVAVVGLRAAMRAIEANDAHTCATTEQGGAKCWGWNDYGQLGDGTTTRRLTSMTVLGLNDGQALSAGVQHSCAVTMTGRVKCWGANASGQLGDGTFVNQRLTPVDVIGLSVEMAAVSAGGAHTCALTASGGAECWGSNTSGQLGDGGLFGAQAQPVAVAGLATGVLAVSAGNAHTCARLANGGVQCWGGNEYGQLGDDTQTSRPTPVAVVGLVAGVRMEDIGAQHSCAVLADGRVKCWGANRAGQLGNGTVIDCLVPAEVWNLDAACAAVTEIPERECRALVAFFKATDGLHWLDRTHWLRTTTPCSWWGIACASGHVSQLNLPDNKLAGALPDALSDLAGLQRLDLHGNALDGPLPAALGNLAGLQFLDLSDSGLAGATLPPEWGGLSALRNFDLHGNALMGALPAELGSLAALQYLDLHNNYLRGRLPSELGQLTNIQHFDLSHNFFDKDILWTAYGRFADFPALIYLDFSYNCLDGPLPEGLDSLTAMTYLDLSHNCFRWEIPWELGNLPALQYLNLANNQLSDVVPPRFGNLTAVQRLDLGSNFLSGALPPELGQLRALTYLDLHNNLLSGVIPPELGHLGGATESKLAAAPAGVTSPPGVYLDLAGNHLIGSIPAELGQNARLVGLQLSGNQLSGPVPAAVSERQYYFLDLNYNQLTPTDPRWRDTQTVSPTELRATTTDDTVTLNWTPIHYTGDGGFYEISYATAPGGPFDVHGYTEHKAIDTYTITGLLPHTVYYFRLRTFTPAHTYNAGWDVFAHTYVQQNNLWSDYTPLVSVNVAVTATPTPSATITPTPSPTATGTPSPAPRVFLPLVWRGADDEP